MPIIDVTTDVGRIRMRIGDYSDLPILPDQVIEQALIDNNGNVKSTTLLCAQYILASLAFKSHKKMQLLELWGKESFDSYMEFLDKVLLNPTFSGVCPIPYSASNNEKHPIIVFQEDFYNAMNKPTSDERLHDLANGPYLVPGLE